MQTVLTETADHYTNPLGVAWQLVASGIECSPVDPMATAEAQAYPLDKLYMARQLFTKASGFAAGDRLNIGSVTYTVRAVHSYAALGGLDAYTHLIVEEKL